MKIHQGDFGSGFGWVSDYLMTNYQTHGIGGYVGSSNAPNRWYGGLWGIYSANTQYVDSQQTSAYFVGTNTIAPDYLGVGGNLYDNSNGMFTNYECGIGYYSYFPSSPYPVTDIYANQYYLGGTGDPSQKIYLC